MKIASGYHRSHNGGSLISAGPTAAHVYAIAWRNCTAFCFGGSCLYPCPPKIDQGQSVALLDMVYFVKKIGLASEQGLEPRMTGDPSVLRGFFFLPCIIKCPRTKLLLFFFVTIITALIMLIAWVKSQGPRLRTVRYWSGPHGPVMWGRHAQSYGLGGNMRAPRHL